MIPMKAVVAAAALLSLPSLALAKPGASDQPARAGAPAASPLPAGFVELAVTADGFVPDKLHLKKGQKVKLLVTRRTDRTCATEIVIPDAGVNQKLPLNQTVVVELTPAKSGTLKYACAMGHIGGVLVVE